MERTTRKQIEGRLDTVARLMGRQREAWIKREDGTYRANIGALYLDHNTFYGGYVVEEIATDGGGVRRPFGDGRLTAAEMWTALGMVADALYMAGVGRTVAV